MNASREECVQLIMFECSLDSVPCLVGQENWILQDRSENTSHLHTPIVTMNRKICHGELLCPRGEYFARGKNSIIQKDLLKSIKSKST